MSWLLLLFWSVLFSFRFLSSSIFVNEVLTVSVISVIIPVGLNSPFEIVSKPVLKLSFAILADVLSRVTSAATSTTPSTIFISPFIKSVMLSNIPVGVN